MGYGKPFACGAKFFMTICSQCAIMDAFYRKGDIGMQPLVTVIVPVYMRPRILAGVLKVCAAKVIKTWRFFW